jgi:hypothetical protein
LTGIKAYGWLVSIHLWIFFRENMNMASFSSTIAAAALLAVCSVVCNSPASAQVARPQIGQGASAPANLLTEVQYRGYRGRWGGPGPAIGLGIAAGILAGAAIASQPYYYGPGYYPPGYYPPPPPPGDPGAYCMSRFKSYDPGSGTYLGYDGLRHPCP